EPRFHPDSRPKYSRVPTGSPTAAPLRVLRGTAGCTLRPLPVDYAGARTCTHVPVRSRGPGEVEVPDV
ncbi:MAG: hypothetical protein AVDCRST_MAG34-2021, partial [uncultured Nocardioidaceae bacterium]